MTMLPADRSESSFEDYKDALTLGQALVEANRCLFCYDAPCIQACPTQIDIPQFIRKITTGNIRGSAQTIFDSNIFGMSCARVCPVEVLCVGDCVYNLKDEPPIQIGKLQRYATDQAFAAGWTLYKAGPSSGKSVALIGGGPASLAAAHELRRHGHAVTIYEKRQVLGGLNTTGVAPYKMRADDALREVEWILSIGGIDVKLGVDIGKDVQLAELELWHDAVFIGAGLGPDTHLEVPGAQLQGVFGAVEWIEQMKLTSLDLSQIRSAVVIGGGNTAIDAVRELKGLGIPEVTMVYRGDESGKSGYSHEWAAAKLENIVGSWRSLPTGFVGDTRVSAVLCVRMDENKQPIPGTEFSIAADLVLLAIGQSKLGELLAALPGIEQQRGKIVIDDVGGTGRPRWFAGGDCANGGKEVVNAAAEGKRAANAIHSFLTGDSHA